MSCTDDSFESLKIGQEVYFARVLPPVGVFDVLDLKIRTIEDTWFVASEKRTKQAFLFSKNCVNKTVFLSRNLALNCVKTEENKANKVKLSVYYEED